MFRKLTFLALILLAAIALQAATTSTTMTVNATASIGVSGVTATGTATFTNGIPNGNFTATVPVSSIGASGNVSVPFTITFSGSTGTLTGTITLPATLLFGGGSGSGSASITGGTGTYSGATGSFTLTGNGSLSGTTITLTFTGPGSITTGGSTGGGGGTTTPPAPTITAVWDAAGNTPSLAPGSIFIVKGSNLCPSGTNFFNVPRPTVAPDGVKITFTPTSGGSGTDALLWYEYNPSGTCQLAGILPSTVAAGNYNVTVTNGSVSAGFATTVKASKFSLFTQDSTGTGLASVQNYISQSQVDLNSFSSGNGKGTTISPARPGQPLLAYGTGLGALVGGDNTASPAYDFSTHGVTIQAVVGGVTIPVVYAGRAGYAGEDQINFTLPANVPTGCAVSFQISVNGTLSNATFIAIAPDATSSTCVLPGFTSQQLQKFDQGGTMTVGGFSLSNISETLPAPIGTTSLGFAAGGFTQYSGYQLAALASSSALSVTTSTSGSCTIYQVSGTASSPVVTNGGTSLDAGAITLTGPTGSNLTNVALTESNNVYSVSIGGPSILGGVAGNLVGGTYTLNGAGGKDVGKFNASVTLGSPLVITGGLPASVTESNPLILNWTGGNSSDTVEVIGSSTTTAASTEFICTTTAGARTLTVPSAILTQLPKSTSGFLEVASFPSLTGTNGQFTAPLTAGGNIDLGFFFGLSGTGAQVAYQ